MRFERRRSFGGFRDRYQDRESDMPKPVKAGEEYDVEISEVGAKGDGIARINNFVVFVSEAKKGEKIKVKITEVRNRFAIGEKVGAAEAKEEVKAEVEAETEGAEEVESEAAESEEEETTESEETETSEESEEVSEEI